MKKTVLLTNYVKHGIIYLQPKCCNKEQFCDIIAFKALCVNKTHLASSNVKIVNCGMFKGGSAMKYLLTVLVVVMITTMFVTPALAGDEPATITTATATAPYTWGAVGDPMEEDGVRYHAIQTAAEFLAAASGKEVTILAYEEGDELVLELMVDAKCISVKLLQGWLTGEFTLLLREDIVRTLLRECLI